MIQHSFANCIKQLIVKIRLKSANPSYWPLTVQLILKLLLRRKVQLVQNSPLCCTEEKLTGLLRHDKEENLVLNYHNWQNESREALTSLNSPFLLALSPSGACSWMVVLLITSIQHSSSSAPSGRTRQYTCHTSQINTLVRIFIFLMWAKKKLQHTPTGSFWLLEAFFGGRRRGVLPFLLQKQKNRHRATNI